MFLKPRFCNQLELKQENLIQKTAVYVAERAKEVCDIQSRAPDSIAGAAIYMACAAAGERKPMKGKNSITKKKILFYILSSDIQVVAGVMESTIRQIYKIMLPKAAELFPADFQFQCPPANLPSS